MSRNTGPDKPTRELVKLRDNYTCQYCGRHIGDDGEIQHRRARKMGGSKAVDTNLPSNLVYLCRACHHEKVEARPFAAKQSGFRVPDGRIDLERVPLDSYVRGWVLLLHDGTFIPAKEDVVESWHDFCFARPRG